MTLPRDTVCEPWITIEELESLPCVDLDGIDDEVILENIECASEILFHLSRRMFPGTCDDEVFPNVRGPGDACSCGCSGGRLYGCHQIPEIQLGGAPITSVTEVKIDGEVLVEGVDYEVDDYRWLVRLGGQGWPCCQDRNADPDDPTNCDHTFRVQYEFGKQPTVGGKKAAKWLAWEAIKACNGQKCRLASRTTTVTRDGTTAVILDPFDFLDQDRTGIIEADSWLNAVNPSGRRRRAMFMSPVSQRAVRRRDTTQSGS